MTATLESSAPARTTRCTNRVGRHRSNRPRTFNLIDLENLVGGRVNSSAVRDVWSEFGEVIDTRYTDLTTVAVSQQHAAMAFLNLPANLHRVIGSNGPDGADTALIDSVDIGWIASNFGQVVIASGDHIFAPLARRLQRHGLHVVQVIGLGACSAALYRSCNEQKYLARARKAAVLLSHNRIGE